MYTIKDMNKIIILFLLLCSIVFSQNNAIVSGGTALLVSLDTDGFISIDKS